jgi:RepB DNA-primase from phage plasmid
VEDQGFFLTQQAIRRQLAAMPNDLYLVRLIHQATRKAVPGERLWTAAQLVSPGTVRFLRARNREGCDIYIQPYAGDRNAGYVLVDLDRARPGVLAEMQANGHLPCVVVQTSPGHLQAWVRLSTAPLEPAVATAAGRQLALIYGADLASADWRHLGRLAGFTNQKPARRSWDGYPPWAKLIHARESLAPRADTLLDATPRLDSRVLPPDEPGPGHRTITEGAQQIYTNCLRRWRIHERFPQPDWSIVDLWVARHLLRQGTPAQQVQQVIRLASPGFPRHHADPADYLRRTLARAAAFPFPCALRALCVTHPATASAAVNSSCSNSTGGR